MNAAADEQPAPVIDVLAVDDELLRLLAASGLPVEDIAGDRPLTFFGCRDADRLLAVIGLEHGTDATLLRSLAVAPEARGRGLARRLVGFVENLAAAQGEPALFLLTATAADFFRRLGYVDLDRGLAPRSVRASEQFTRLCPDDAALLVKPLAET